ncbi:MAG: hypothetical protein ACR2F4_02070, partial [Thermoleophilaceae bacterium]
GFLPGLPEVELDPELVLLIFLPPLLYSAAFFSNLRELRANARDERAGEDRWQPPPGSPPVAAARDLSSLVWQTPIPWPSRSR